MSGNGTSSAVKWVALVLVVGAIGLVVWRLKGTGGGATTPTMLACDGCGFRGQVDVPVGFDEWPFPCPKCEKPTAQPAFPCPHCGKLLAWPPKAPPTTCTFCKASLEDAGD